MGETLVVEPSLAARTLDVDVDVVAASRSVARVATENASRFLKQLCKHFAHELPTTFDDADGRIDFPIGVVRLAADVTGLDLSLASPTDRERGELEDVVGRHLLRFAFREELVVDWQRIASTAHEVR